MKKIKNSKKQKKEKTFSELYDSRYLKSELKNELKLGKDEKSKELIKKQFSEGIYVGTIFFRYRMKELPVGLSYITLLKESDEFYHLSLKMEISKSDLPFNLKDKVNGKVPKLKYEFTNELKGYVDFPLEFIIEKQ